MNIKNRDGKTPLECARNKNKPEVVQLLNDWPLYQSYRNRQIMAFCESIEQNPEKYYFDGYIVGKITRRLRKHDTIEQIHEIAEKERIYQILILTNTWINNEERALIKV